MPVKKLDIQFKEQFAMLKMIPRKDIFNEASEGELSTNFKGTGIEFAGFRKYTFGDDASSIDWRASLRAHDVLVKEFESYKNVPIFFLFDVSDSMVFSSGTKTKAEYGAELIYSLAVAFSRAGDAVGMGMFSDKLSNVFTPDFGGGITNLFKLKLDDPKNYGGVCDIKKAILFLEYYLPEKVVIFLVSDFLGYRSNWASYLTSLSNKFEFIGVVIRDKRDYLFPKSGGQFYLKDPFSEDVRLVDVSKARKEYERLSAVRYKVIENVLLACRGDMIVLDSDEPFFDRVMDFMKQRSKKYVY